MRALILLFTVTLATTPVTAAFYDAVRDFSLAANPAGPWSYGQGTSNPIGSTFTPYTLASTDCGGVVGLSCWNGGNGSVPFVGLNVTGNIIDNGVVRLPLDQLVLHPQANDIGFADTAVRWTAPASGRYRLSGHFEVLAPLGARVGVFLVGANPIDGTVFGQLERDVLQSGPNPMMLFAFEQFFAAGEFIDFALTANGDTAIDYIGFATIVTPVPLPPALPLCAVALGFLATRSHRHGRAGVGRGPADSRPSSAAASPACVNH